QLSALKTEDAAKAEWKRIFKQNADILGGLSMNIQRADLGAKGVYWRLRGAYLPDRKSAEGVCAKLATRKLGCLIIAP
ncbi:MAG: SPOR domain-containing protein, partial [Rhodospirillaceae bacterium]|nr:SPOR domain-containing protein [Rhodospirillaceae bacterium]